MPEKLDSVDSNVQMIDALPTSIAQRSTQFSLLELFFALTLSGVAIGVHTYISSLLAMVISAGLLLVASVRLWPSHNSIIGALRGFFMAGLIAWICICFGVEEYHSKLGIAVLLPPLGYLIGYLNSESLNYDD